MSGTAAPEQAPATLRWAVRLLFVEGAGLALLTLLFVYFDLTSEWTAAEIALSTTGYLALMTVLFLSVAVALHRRRRWARGPGIVAQMLQMPIGWTMLTHGQPLIGVPLFALGLAGAILLFAPSTRIALGIR
ncbi:hypothetical protein Daura_05285 [Dactylosporangium aurantiacum]|uniref:Integral membrane protein n=1 Tax=Dactylosporangium aurantiacum TaxID=35754 RepID=A0A9Q9ME08_9ACTN|nr:hypothetical protein [Dactylosporangium aurantiacum]MDG6104820.1 hypothetical protein [Dactylosporangium aurantiacum]UWZ55628.1 hypothetical protein Daura_05285 [Dactylosporangium aurantiacum]